MGSLYSLVHSQIPIIVAIIYEFKLISHADRREKRQLPLKKSIITIMPIKTDWFTTAFNYEPCLEARTGEKTTERGKNLHQKSTNHQLASTANIQQGSFVFYHGNKYLDSFFSPHFVRHQVDSRHTMSLSRVKAKRYFLQKHKKSKSLLFIYVRLNIILLNHVGGKHTKLFKAFKAYTMEHKPTLFIARRFT